LILIDIELNGKVCGSNYLVAVLD